MTDRFNSTRPDGEPTIDRWAGALHLFDGDSHEESWAERWERAELLFEGKGYIEAARLLSGLVEEFPDQVAPRLLLARSYYHSAQLWRAEEQLREVISRDPVESYAYLMLGRTLQRQGHPGEAEPWMRMADAFSDEARG